MSDSVFPDPFLDPFLDPFAEPVDREAAHPTATAGDRGDPGRPGGRGRTGPEGRLPESLSAVIALEAEQAVEAFLEYIHLWWPAVLRACGEDSHLGFEDGMLLEEGVEGNGHRWADVVGAEGTALSLRWFGGPWRTSSQPGPQTGAEVTVGFAAVSGSRTRVTVRGTSPASWADDWSCALDAYSRFTGSAGAGQTPETPAG